MTEGKELERLTYDEVDLVLRRATEIQHGDPKADAGFTLDEVQRIGSEIGLSPEAVSTALVHVRSTALARTTQTAPTLADRLIGPAVVVAQRRVPGPASAVRYRIEEFMKKQLFRIKRNFGDRVQWERAEGLLSKVRRALDIGDEYKLGDAEELEVSVVDLPGAGEVEVVMIARFEETRREQATGVLVGTGLMVVGGVVGAVLLAPVAMVGAVAAAAGGVGLSAAVVSGSRRQYRKKVEQVRDALEGVLDGLEHAR